MDRVKGQGRGSVPRNTTKIISLRMKYLAIILSEDQNRTLNTPKECKSKGVLAASELGFI